MLLVLPLSGCFVYIPGSVIDATSDAITGSEGENCVNTAAKVGDLVKTSSGTMTVVSLSGTSSRCKDPNLPIRAKLAAAIPAPAPPINLSADWKAQPLGSDEPERGIFAHAVNKSLDAAVVYSSVTRSSVPDVQQFAEKIAYLQMAKLTNPERTPVHETTCSGRTMFAIEVTGTINGHRLTYADMIMPTDKTIIEVSAWGFSEKFPAQADALRHTCEFVANM